ncbi:MAG: protein kinase [Rhodoglobus sp.]
MRRPASTPPELPGYSYVKLLGSGGFADVFLYDQKLPKRRVAVKVLLIEEVTAASRAAFVAEANLMAQLSAHPYIVTIYQADVSSDDRPYLVMEYCSGPSLADRYKRETFEVADALRTGVRLSSAVATAHAAGILHRDIKPANVLSNDYGWPALTDFGISSAVDDDALPTHTMTAADALSDTSTNATGASVGMSVPWSPPEMFGDDPQPDVRSDVFALAATIWTILANQTPFEVSGRSNSTLDLIGRIERGAITPMTRTDIPRSLLAVLHKGMASDRADRFSTAVDFARALQRVELELGYAPTTIDVPNLTVSAPDRSAAAEGGEDETKVRSVATIQAQPAVGMPPAAASGTAAVVPDTSVNPASAEATVVRGVTGVEAQPRSSALSTETIIRRREPSATAAADEEVVAESAEPRSRRGRVIGWVIGGVAAVIAAAVVVSVILFGSGSGPDTVKSPTATEQPVIIAGVPTPKLVSKSEAGGVVTFVVSNPAPEGDDVVVWRISNRTASEGMHKAEGLSFDVPGYEAGSTVCVEVSVLRSGKLSVDPLEECYPQ